MMTSNSDSPSAGVVRSPQFFEFSGELLAAHAAGTLSPGWTFAGEHSWIYRTQNFVVDVSWLGEGQVEERPAAPDEHALLILEGMSLDLTVGAHPSAALSEPLFAVVPPEKTRIVCSQAGFVVRIYSSRAEHMVSRAHNAGSYAESNPSVAGLPDTPSRPAGDRLRLYPLSEIPVDPSRFGRIFRTDSLMINWFAPQDGPRDTNRLSPHSHDDFEQASITMAGEYVHHIRRPWTERLQDWRPDEHVQISSPSVTIIPPGNIHTTRAVGPGIHHLIDVFAPPRQDFIDRGWVLNQADYESHAHTTERKSS